MQAILASSRSVIELAAWAHVTEQRRGHIDRVAALVRQWAAALDVAAGERERWLRAVALHDALKDAPQELLRELAPGAWGIDALRHGPAAARMAEREGETDRGVLSAVRYHSVGWVGWDDAGRMLYLADYLEPGRDFSLQGRTELIERVPEEADVVLCEVARLRIGMLHVAGLEPFAESVEFLESLRCGV